MSNENLKHLGLSDSGFLFDAMTGNTFSLNKTGKVILKGLIEDLSINEISELLNNKFEVEKETAKRDVEQFLHNLIEINLISNYIK